MSFLLKLVKNPDIIASVASLEKDRPFVVGFAAETQNVAEYAKSKLQRKNLDMIVPMMYRVGKYSDKIKMPCRSFGKQAKNRCRWLTK